MALGFYLDNTPKRELVFAPVVNLIPRGISTMKSKIVLAAAFTLLFAQPTLANAAPSCVRGTLASYIALGAGGCMFDNALYDNFTYAPTSTVGISPANIIVTPIQIGRASCRGRV